MAFWQIDNYLIVLAFGGIVIVEFGPQPAGLNSDDRVYAGVVIAVAAEDFGGNDVLFKSTIAVFDGLLDDKAKKAAAAAAEKKNAEVEQKMTGGRENMRDSMFRSIRNEGEIVDRRALSDWETYAQALLLSNEAAYVN